MSAPAGKGDGTGDKHAFCPVCCDYCLCQNECMDVDGFRQKKGVGCPDFAAPPPLKAAATAFLKELAPMEADLYMCDHSVGICACGIRADAEALEVAVKVEDVRRAAAVAEAVAAERGRIRAATLESPDWPGVCLRLDDGANGWNAAARQALHVLSHALTPPAGEAKPEEPA